MSSQEIHERLDRVPWLDLARAQSRAAAARRAERVPRLRWAAFAPRSRWQGWRLPQLVGAALALLALLGSGTYAFVVHVAPSAVGAREEAPQGEPLRRIVHRARRVGPAPVARVARPAATVAPAGKVVERRVRSRVARREAAPKRPAQKIDVSDGAFQPTVIIVRPRQKLKPLFSTEEYKRRR